MDELSRIIGQLEEFKDTTKAQLTNIEQKVDALNMFKWKATGIMIAVLGAIEIVWRLVSEVRN